MGPGLGQSRSGSDLTRLGSHRWPVTSPTDRSPLRRCGSATGPSGRGFGDATQLAEAVGGHAASGESSRAGHVQRAGPDVRPPGSRGPAAALAGALEPGDGRPLLAGQLTVSGIVGGSASWGQIGYWVDQRWAGRGITPTAVALATDYCFKVMRLHRIEIAIRPENTKSLRVVEKLRFRPEGLRPRYLHIDGDWRDHLVFALNSEEVPEGLLRRWNPDRS